MTNNFDKSNDLEVAKFILNENDLFYCNGYFNQYKNNFWAPVDDKFIKNTILGILEEKYKQSNVRNILDILQVMSMKTEHEINLNDQKGLINCLNGFLDVNTGELIPHAEETKRYYSTNQFLVNYSPGATCKRWLQFLDEIFEPDPDKFEKISLLQEFMGLCLTRETKHEKALFLLGNGSNGKSKILDVLEAILGKANFSSLEFDQLGKQFLTYQLVGKLLNVCTDIDYQNRTSAGAFKRIVTGETILVDIKNKTPLQFKPHCKLIFAANRLPQATDTSKGYFRRLFILKLNRSFDGVVKDKDLKRKLLAEVDGVFLWIIDGLQRLQHNQKFTQPKSSDDELDKYLENSNSVVAFVLEQCEILDQSDYWVGYQELFDVYRKFCADSGIHNFKKTEFRQEVVDRQFKGHIFCTRQGDRGNHFQNIRLKK